MTFLCGKALAQFHDWIEVSQLARFIFALRARRKRPFHRGLVTDEKTAMKFKILDHSIRQELLILACA